MLTLFALPPSQGSVEKFASSAQFDQWVMGHSLDAIGMHFLSNRSRELKVGASLPQLPTKVTSTEAMFRIKSIRSLQSQSFMVLKFSTPASCLQDQLGSNTLSRDSQSPQLFRGRLGFGEPAEICKVKPLEPNLDFQTRALLA